MWSQTPAFSLVLDSKDDIGINMKVHHGAIKSLEFEQSSLPEKAQQALRTAVVGVKLHEIRDWTSFLENRVTSWDERLATVAKRLDQLLPVPEMPKH
jgi:lipoate-protein ligase A